MNDIRTVSKATVSPKHQQQRSPLKSSLNGVGNGVDRDVGSGIVVVGGGGGGSLMK